MTKEQYEQARHILAEIETIENDIEAYKIEDPWQQELLKSATVAYRGQCIEILTARKKALEEAFAAL